MASQILYGNVLRDFDYEIIAGNTGIPSFPAGAGFDKLHDGAGHTFCDFSNQSQVFITLDFGTTINADMLAIYGHEGGIVSVIKATDLSLPSQSDSHFLNDDGTCTAIDLNTNVFRYLIIAFANVKTIANMHIGRTVQVDIAPRFAPPYFQVHEESIKRMRGAAYTQLPKRKIPKKLKVKLTTMDEAKLNAASVNSTSDPFFSIGLRIQKESFFLIWDDSNLNEVYWCTADKTISQPRLKGAVTFDWTIPIIGYAS